MGYQILDLFIGEVTTIYTDEVVNAWLETEEDGAEMLFIENEDGLVFKTSGQMALDCGLLAELDEILKR